MAGTVQHLWVDEPLGERHFRAADLPLTFGGTGAQVLLPGIKAGQVVAQLALHAGRVFLQPEARLDADAGGAAATASPRWWREELPVTAACWLQDGERYELTLGDRPATPVATLVVHRDSDTVRLEVLHAGGANVTAPPLLHGGALETLESEDGGGERWVQPAPFVVPVAAGTTPLLVDAAGAPPVWRRAALWGGGGLLLTLLVFFFMAGAVQVRVAPDLLPDQVDFVGTWLEAGSGGSHLVWPGDYTVQVTKAGYVTARVRLHVGREPQVLRVLLAKAPGILLVDTAGVGGKASVNGGPSTPVPGPVRAPAGAQELLVRAPKYADARVRVDVQGAGVEQAVRVKLEPAYAAVTFATLPAGASVRVDGDELGRTPLTVDVGAGHREAVFTLAGYAAFTADFTVMAAQPQQVGPVPLRRPPATVELMSEPTGAQVSVAGQFRGRTPLVLTLDTTGAQLIAVSKLGYATLERSLHLEPGSQRRERLVLVPQLGDVALSGTPADAQLFVDGAPRGIANQVLHLPAAPTTLEVRREGLESFSATVTPRAGFRQDVKFALLSVAERKAAALPGLRRTALGQELRLMPVATFTLGSPRREAGRRSNEAQRRVELRRRFYLGTQEVTNAEFRQFNKEHLSGVFKQETLDLDNRPVVNVGWAEAVLFCNWLSARDGLPLAYAQQEGRWVLLEPATTGYRLPTEAEWELAARWDGAAPSRKYPWGATLPVLARSGNYADAQAVYLAQSVIPGYDDGFRVTAPVGSFAPNTLGLYDLGGNAAEWTTEVYQVFAEGGELVVDPVARGAGTQWTVRGAHWLSFAPGELRVAWRDNNGSPRQTVGFRLARYAE